MGGGVSPVAKMDGGLPCNDAALINDDGLTLPQSLLIDTTYNYFVRDGNRQLGN